MYGNEGESLSAQTQKLESELKDTKVCLQKIKRDWLEVRASLRVDERAEELSDGLAAEICASIMQMRDYFSKECSAQNEELHALQTDIYVDSLWITERLEEVAELQHRTAKLSKAVG